MTNYFQMKFNPVDVEMNQIQISLSFKINVICCIIHLFKQQIFSMSENAEQIYFINQCSLVVKYLDENSALNLKDLSNCDNSENMLFKNIQRTNNSNDWERSFEIYRYKMNQRDEGESHEYICYQCKYTNNRLKVIQNGCKCTKCNADMEVKINNKHNYVSFMPEPSRDEFQLSVNSDNINCDNTNSKIVLNDNTKITLDKSFFILEDIIRNIDQNYFGNDMISLIINDFNRHNIMNETEMQRDIFSQLCWMDKDKQLNTQNIHKTLSNMGIMSKLKEKYDEIDGNKYHKILISNGKVRLANTNENKFSQFCMCDFKNNNLRFALSNPFYRSLIDSITKVMNNTSSTISYNAIQCIQSAFKSYENEICPMLSTNHTVKINDNIYVYWVYLWALSIICRKQMEPSAEYVPLQIDLAIIPNDNIDVKTGKSIDDEVGDIFDRLTIHNIPFNKNNQKVIIDPRNIESVICTIEKLIQIYINIGKRNAAQNRIIIVVDRRVHHKSPKDDLYCFIPPTYATIDEKYGIISSINNTSQFILPPSNDHKTIKGNENNNLIVVSYLIRSKHKFKHLYYEQYDTDEKEQLCAMQHFKSSPNQTHDNMQSSNAIIDTFLFWKGGHCRLESMDLKRIIPKLFTDKAIPESFTDFDLLHPNLWNVTNDIWNVWNQSYLQRAQFVSFSINNHFQINEHNKRIINQNCQLFDKKEVKISENNKYFEDNIACLRSLIDEDIQVIDEENIAMKDIIITNNISEYCPPDLSKINCTFSTIYDVWGYRKTELALNNYQQNINKSTDVNEKKCNEKWQQYKQQFPVIDTSPKILIADNIVGYHFFTVALSHVIRALDKYKPFQVSMGIISNQISTFDSIEKSQCKKIDMDHLLNRNNIRFET
eukprot:99413_1